MAEPTADDIRGFMEEDERRDWDAGKITPEERDAQWQTLIELWKAIPDPTDEQLQPPYMRPEDWQVCQSDFRARENILNFYRRQWKRQRKAEARAELEKLKKDTRQSSIGEAEEIANAEAEREAKAAPSDSEQSPPEMPDYLRFATGEERKWLEEGSLSDKDRDALLAELQAKDKQWRAFLMPSRPELTQFTTEENRREIRFGRATPELWKQIEDEWRRAQIPGGGVRQMVSAIPVAEDTRSIVQPPKPETLDDESTPPKKYRPSTDQIKQLCLSRNISEAEAWAFLESDTRDAKDMLAYLEYEGRQVPPDDPPTQFDPEVLARAREIDKQFEGAKPSRVTTTYELAREQIEREKKGLPKQSIFSSSPLPQTKSWLDAVLESPVFAGVLALIALAIGFSPKASTLGTWVCLAAAWLLFIRMVYMLEHVRVKPSVARWKITGLAALLSFVVLSVFGFWLMQPLKSAIATAGQPNSLSTEPLVQPSPQPTLSPSPSKATRTRESLSPSTVIRGTALVRMGEDLTVHDPKIRAEDFVEIKPLDDAFLDLCSVASVRQGSFVVHCGNGASNGKLAWIARH